MSEGFRRKFCVWLSACGNWLCSPVQLWWSFLHVNAGRKRDIICVVQKYMVKMTRKVRTTIDQWFTCTKINNIFPGKGPVRSKKNYCYWTADWLVVFFLLTALPAVLTLFVHRISCRIIYRSSRVYGLCQGALGYISFGIRLYLSLISFVVIVPGMQHVLQVRSLTVLILSLSLLSAPKKHGAFCVWLAHSLFYEPTKVPTNNTHV